MNAMPPNPMQKVPKRGRPQKHETKDPFVGLKSLDTALSVLEMIAICGPTSLSAIARATKIPSSTAYRILTTFAAREHVELNEEAQLWQLGSKSHFIGLHYYQPLGLKQMAAPILNALAHDSGETAVLGSLCKNGVLIIDQSVGSQPLCVQLPTDQVLRSSTSAHGKALLAEASKATRKRHGFSLKIDVPNVTVAKDGAVDDGETFDGLTGVAMVVTDGLKAPVAAIGVYAPQSRMTDEALAGIDRLTVQAAATLTMKLGGRSLPSAYGAN